MSLLQGAPVHPQADAATVLFISSKPLALLQQVSAGDSFRHKEGNVGDTRLFRRV